MAQPKDLPAENPEDKDSSSSCVQGALCWRTTSASREGLLAQSQDTEFTGPSGFLQERACSQLLTTIHTQNDRTASSGETKSL